VIILLNRIYLKTPVSYRWTCKLYSTEYINKCRYPDSPDVCEDSPTFDCTGWDKNLICNSHDPIVIALAFTECRKYCDLCDCYDDETETFKCAELDKFNFCTDPNSLASAVAHEKCRKHCGFCGPHTTSSAPVTVASTTAEATLAPTTPMTTSEPPLITTTTGK